jgi:hypothetical protein
MANQIARTIAVPTKVMAMILYGICSINSPTSSLIAWDGGVNL